MSTFFAKPENALKRAEELIAVGQKNVALQALHDVITSKRHRTWQKVLEKVMIKYIELCVELRKGKMAKDGLIQYRMICQQVNVSSLEEVIRHFLELAEDRAKNAQSKAEQTVLDIDDLEAAEETPESLMLSSVSGENTRDRADREVVTPWLKFLWETYRTVLEILRHNAKLESVYQDTAQRAFAFCLKYKRNTEFRRLSDILRTHLANLNKYPNQQQQSINLNSPESMTMHLETRFSQLNAATELELWQEAYRSIEDIHGLMSMAKKSPKPSMMITYYQKLTQIFWVSENFLFHAYAWYKLYTLTRAQQKNISQDDTKIMASQVLLAALSIPPTEKKASGFHFDFDLEKEKNLRMATLMGFSTNPRRDSLLAELTVKNVITNALPQIKEIYSVLEVEFHPLELSQKVKPLLEFLGEHPTLKLYLKPIQHLVLLRVLKQLSQVYKVLKISEFQKLIPFISFYDAERSIVEAVKHSHLTLRIDHQNGTINFGSESFEAENMRNMLVNLGQRLAKAASLVAPPIDGRFLRMKQDIFVDILRALPEEHHRLLQRKNVIEKRKEEQERSQLLRQKEEEAQKYIQQKVQEETEAQRLHAEAQRREHERAMREKEKQEIEKRIKIATEILKQTKGTLGKDDAELLKLNEQELKRKQLDLLSMDRQEMEKRHLALSKRLDHLERARREEERSLLEQAYIAQQAADLAFHKEQVETLLTASKAQHNAEISEKHRLQRMVADKDEYERELHRHRMEEFSKRNAVLAERYSVLKAKKMAERERIRQEEEAIRVEEERLERIRAEEEQRRVEEEERVRQAEEEKRRLKEEEEKSRKAKLAEIEERKRKREAEIEQASKEREEKERQERELAAKERREKSSVRDEGHRAPSWRDREQQQPPAQSGSWRDRQESEPAVREDKYQPPANREARFAGAGRDGVREDRYAPAADRRVVDREPVTKERDWRSGREDRERESGDRFVERERAPVATDSWRSAGDRGASRDWAAPDRTAPARAAPSNFDRGAGGEDRGSFRREAGDRAERPADRSRREVPENDWRSSARPVESEPVEQRRAAAAEPERRVPPVVERERAPIVFERKVEERKPAAEERKPAPAEEESSALAPPQETDDGFTKVVSAKKKTGRKP
mmetsp:Transcript_33594/g.54432  ORF Transcript_33594/g.54432 Transcript_33594/m.54432 type:complete len:1134 (+) Transcript_33594:97-3498(+)